MLSLGCDDDGDDDRDAAVATDAGGADGGIDAGGGGDPVPVIMEVAWEAVPGCVNNTPSDVEITVTVVDGDTPSSMLTFSGIAVGCTGTIDAATSIVNCPNAAPYPSSVTVTDPEGNSDSVSFTFGQCETGSAEF